MKNIYILFCVLCLSLHAESQTLLDNYDGVGTLTYTVEANWGNSGTNSRWVENTTSSQLEGQNNTSSSPEHSYASYDLSNTFANYELNRSNGLKWFGWMDLNRTSVGGWGTTSYSCGMVLAANAADFNATSTSGFAIGFNDLGNLVLFRFSAGIVGGTTALPGTAVQVVSSGYTYADADNGVNFFVELLSDGKWKISYKTGAKLSDANAINVTNYNSGNATSANVDTTYKGTTYKYAGWIYAHSNGGGQMAYFDNFGAAHTAAASSNSDIIAGGNEPSGVNYINYTGNTINATSDAQRVWSFTLRDGGGSADADSFATLLTALTIDRGASNLTGSWANTINKAALFQGVNEIAEVSVTADSIIFSGLSGANVTAPDNGSITLDLYITYKTTALADQQQFQFRIKRVSINTSGSQCSNFASISSSTSGNSNRINVTASKFRFMQQPVNTMINTALNGVIVEATDANNLRDSDYVSTVRLTSTGVLSGNNIDVTPLKGSATFNNIVHTSTSGSVNLTAMRMATLDWQVSSNAFAITGNANSDIRSDSTYSYTSDVNYTLFQKADSITNTSQSIGVYRFIIRDGGPTLSDADTLPTALNAVTFSAVAGINNIRCAALFDGNSKVSANPVINSAAGTISFSGFVYTINDNASRALTLRLSFESSPDSVTDNQQLSFTIAPAGVAASMSGSQFSSFPSVSSSITGNINRMEVMAGKIKFKTQPTGGTVGSNLAAFTIQAQDTFGVCDLDYSGNINLSSSGTGMTSSGTYTLSSGAVNISNVSFSAAQNNIYLIAVGSGMSIDNDDTSATFNISTFAANSYRTKTGGTWPSSGTATWQRFVSGTWQDVSAPAAGVTDSVYILHAISSNASFGSSSSKFIIQTGGSFTVNQNSTLAYCRADSGGTLQVNDAGFALTASASKNFIIGNGANLVFNSSALDNVDPIWDGNEDFQPRSNLTINNWNYSGASNSNRLVANPSQVSANTAGGGFLFGNISIIAAPTQLFSLVTGSQTIKLCQGNLYIDVTTNNVTFNNSTGSVEIGGDLIINGGTFSGAASNSSANLSSIVGGKLRVQNTGVFNFNQNSSSATNYFLNLKGNLEIYNSGSITSTDGGCGLNFVGSSQQNIDFSGSAAVLFEKAAINIKTGAFARIINANMKIGDAVDVTVDSGATLHFGYNGTTPLIISESGGTTSFKLNPYGTIVITSADGIDKDGTQNIGNVRTDTRTFDAAGRYWYKGLRPLQRAGDGLPTASGAKTITIDLDSLGTTFLLEGSNGTTNSSLGNVAMASGGQLNIIQGTFAATNTSDFTGSATLQMTGGLYKTAVDSATSLSPQLTGNYTISGGTIEWNGSNSIQRMRGGRTYYNIKISGNNVYGSNYKTPSSAITLQNNLYITDNAVLQTANSISGDAGLKMDGGVFRISKVTSAQPELGALAVGETYNLTGGTIELYNTTSSGQQTFRTRDDAGRTITYFNLAFNAQSPNSASGNINPNNNFNIAGTLNVNSGCYLRLDASDVIGGTGQFNVNSGAGLLVGHASGLSRSGGQIQVSGNRTYHPGAGYGFIGTTNQTAGDSFPATVSSLYFRKSTLNTYITFSRTIQVADSAIFYIGIATGTPNPLLTFANNARASGFSDSSFVNGPCSKTGNQSFIFPVGAAGTGCQPIGMSAPDHASDQFKATYYRNSPRNINGKLPTGIKQITTCEYWDLHEAADFGTATSISVTLYFDLNSGCYSDTGTRYVSDVSILRVLHHNGSRWEDLGNPSTFGDHDIGGLTVHNVNSFSPFTFGSKQSPANNPLPVTFVSAKVLGQKEVTTIQFDVTSEQGVSHYNLYKLVGNSHPSLLSSCAASDPSHSAGLKTYIMVDSFPSALQTEWYYIEAVSFDGSLDYSPTFKNEMAATPHGIRLPSNPAPAGTLSLQVMEAEGDGELNLYNQEGKRISAQSVIKFTSRVEVEINIPGFYWLEWKCGSQRQLHKLVIY